MRSIRLVAAAALLATSSIALSQAQTQTTPAPAAAAAAPAASADGVTFTPEGFRAHVAFLADDVLEGRNAGDRGYDIAARYVATELEGLGVKPANGSDWYQQVPFVERTSGTAGGLTVGTKTFPNGEGALVGLAKEGPQTWSGDAVFVGYGINDPALKMNDYAGLDVKGKAVVMLNGAPKGLPSDVAATVNGQKSKWAEAAGATAVLQVPSDELLKRFPPAMIRGELSRPQLGLANADGTPMRSAPGIQGSGFLLPESQAAIFAGSPMTAQQVQAAIAAGKPVKGFALKQPIKLEAASSWRRFTSPNVVGFIQGSDPALANEYVLLMAHLDHNGINEKAPGEDKIWNGAMDNATGVATMLEVARAFQQSGTKPKRSILFAAVTAEEDGLLGSDYLARNPLPGKKVVSVVNLDMPILLYDFTDVTAFGAEHSTMGPLVAAAAAKSGVKLSPDPVPEENLFVRSDHYSFVKQGVPSVFLVTGFANGGEAAFKGFLNPQTGNYHKPSDDMKQPINWQAGAKFARVNYDIARSIADAPQAPRWYEGSPFGNQYAKGQPKAPKPAAAK